MLKSLTAIAAAAALSIQGALAGPLGVSYSVGENGDSVETTKDRGVIAFVMRRLGFASVSRDAKAEDRETSYLRFAIGGDEECTSEEHPADEEAHAEEEEKAEPVGPEPIYFGF